MKNITDRHQFILQKLKEEGRVEIQALILLMKVSGVTIRKDLKLLEDKNLLFRTKGGASLTNLYAVDKHINEKEYINSEEKQKIARAALFLIKESDAITIGSGTTVFELARCLYPQQHLTVITPALKVGLELSCRPNVEVLQLGGIIRPNSSSVAGNHAMRVLDEISCEILFIGVDGIDFDFGISISNLAEATLNQKMLETTQTIVILADSSKFGKRGLGRICGLDQVSYIITDDKISPGHIKSMKEIGVKFIIAKS